jgi:hypothetical protein
MTDIDLEAALSRNHTKIALLSSVAAGAVCLSGCGGASSTSSAAPTTTSTAAATTAAAPTTAAGPTSAAPPASSAAGSSASAPATATPSPAAGTAPAGGATAAVGGSCDNATVAVNKATNASPDSSKVVDIELKDGCNAVTVTTFLLAGDSAATATAVKICDTSATPAYANGVGALIVYASDGSTVLASGKKGAACSVAG